MNHDSAFAQNEFAAIEKETLELEATISKRTIHPAENNLYTSQRTESICK